MNVLVLSHLFPTSLRPTRAAFVLEQMRALRELGVEISVVAPVPWVPPPVRRMNRFRKYDSLPRRARVDGFPVMYPRTLVLPRAALFFAYGWVQYLCCRPVVERLLRERRIDLIHAHTIMPDGFAAVLLARDFQLPVVCTVHGSDIAVYPDRNIATRHATHWALREVDGLIAVSRNLADKVQHLGRTRSIHVVRNGANAELFSRLPKAMARAKLGLPSESKLVLFVGNLVEIKGLEFLVKAIAQVQTANSVAYLLGEGKLFSTLAALSQQLGISDRCHLVGTRPHEELRLWFSAADCFVLPSLSEGFPTVLAEAAMTGLPIVATAVGGVPELVEDHRTGLLVPSRDAGALARAIDAVLANSVFANLMAEQARIVARRELTWQVNANHTLAVYREVLAGSHAAFAAA